MNPSRFLRLTRAWLAWGIIKPRFVWSLLAAPALAAIVLHWGPEVAFRSYGFFLQVVGAVIAARQVFSNDRLFQQPRLHDHIATWWGSRPGVTTALRASGGAVTASAGTLTVTTRAEFVAGDSLEAQIAKLWRNIGFIDRELTDMGRDIERNKSAHEAALKAEREARAAAHRQLEDALKEVAVGSSLVAYFGFALVLLGGAITTWSSELHCWAH